MAARAGGHRQAGRRAARLPALICPHASPGQPDEHHVPGAGVPGTRPCPPRATAAGGGEQSWSGHPGPSWILVRPRGAQGARGCRARSPGQKTGPGSGSSAPPPHTSPPAALAARGAPGHLPARGALTPNGRAAAGAPGGPAGPTAFCPGLPVSTSGAAALFSAPGLSGSLSEVSSGERKFRYLTDSEFLIFHAWLVFLCLVHVSVSGIRKRSPTFCSKIQSISSVCLNPYHVWRRCLCSMGGGGPGAGPPTGGWAVLAPKSPVLPR